MLGVRENEDLAQSLGIPITGTKIIAFVLATMFLGLCGSLYAHYFRFISPVSFSVAETFRHVTMLIVGGKGTLLGSSGGGLYFYGSSGNPAKHRRLPMGCLRGNPHGLHRLFAKRHCRPDQGYPGTSIE